MTERLEGQPHAPGAGMPPAERLVNLTEHAVSVESRVASPLGDDGAPVPSMATFAPDGRLARVADGQARLGDGSLNTSAGLLNVTRLKRRPGPVVGLPPAEPGVRYLVSRITALAVPDRTDLVFPFGERRDDHGRVNGVAGLAVFPARPGHQGAVPGLAARGPRSAVPGGRWPRSGAPACCSRWPPLS